MYIEKQLDDFLQRLQICANELAEPHSIDLWRKCEAFEARLEDDHFDEKFWSVLNRVVQEAYYESLDTMVEALRATLLEDDDDEAPL